MAYIEPSQMPVETASGASADTQAALDLANDATQTVEPAVDTLQSASALVANTDVTSTDLVNTDAAQNTAESLSANDAISMSFTADCWVNVVDATGKTLVDGVKGSSRVVEAKGVAPFKLILGAPQVVKIQFNGEEVSLADFSEGRVARLTLPRV